jgi:hypothetical protein
MLVKNTLTVTKVKMYIEKYDKRSNIEGGGQGKLVL